MVFKDTNCAMTMAMTEMLPCKLALGSKFWGQNEGVWVFVGMTATPRIEKEGSH